MFGAISHPTRRMLLAVAAAVTPAVVLAAVLAVPTSGARATPLAAETTSAPVTASPSLPDISPFPPSPPSNVTATRVTSQSITLSWTASKPGCCPVTAYVISYFPAFYDVGSQLTVGNVTTATLTVKSGTEYRITVSARDDMGRWSASSAALRVVTPVTDSGPDTTPPSTPSGLVASDVTDSSAVLTWSPSTDDTGVTGYHVYRFDRVFISTLLATVSGTSYTLPLEAGRYDYYVRARDAVGNVSIASNVVTLTGSGTPTSSPPPVSGSPSVSPSPSDPPDPTCQVRYDVEATWAGGFIARVTVSNLSSAPVNGWTLAFTFGGDQRIRSAWSAAYAQTGADVTAHHLDWNRTIAAGGSVSFGVHGSWATSNAPPSRFALNGSACRETIT
jgi:chitodextrinase